MNFEIQGITVEECRIVTYSNGPEIQSDDAIPSASNGSICGEKSEKRARGEYSKSHDAGTISRINLIAFCVRIPDP